MIKSLMGVYYSIVKSYSKEKLPVILAVADGRSPA